MELSLTELRKIVGKRVGEQGTQELSFRHAETLVSIRKSSGDSE